MTRWIAILLALLAGTGEVRADAFSSTPPAVASVFAGPGLNAYGSNQLTTSNTVISVTATTYAITTANAATLLQFNNASGVAVSLPSAATTGYTAGFAFGVQNEGTANVVVTPAAGLINGLSSLTVLPLTGCEINSDGLNWRVGPSCTAVVPGAAGSGITQLTGDVTAGPGTGPQVATVAKIGGVTPGTAVGANTGTSGANLGFLNGANTWSGLQNYSANIQMNNGAAGTPAIFGTGTTTGLFFSSSTVQITAGGSARACGSASGVAVNSCTFSAVAGGQTPLFQVQGNTNGASANSALITSWVNSASIVPTLLLGKSKSGTIGTQTTVASTDTLSAIFSEGSDGTGFINASSIETGADGTVSTGIVPGRVSVKTANSAGTMTEGLRVDSKQHVSFKNSAAPAIGNGTADANASDTTGTITATAAVTSATVTFAAAFATFNHCRVTSQSGLSGFGYSYTLSVLTVTATGLGGTKFDYHCDGQ